MHKLAMGNCKKGSKKGTNDNKNSRKRDKTIISDFEKEKGRKKRPTPTKPYGKKRLTHVFF